MRRSWDARKIVVVGYFALLLVYLLIGLTPARAAEYEAATEMRISKIGLVTDVVPMQIERGVLTTPDSVVGSYSRALNKTFLVGHSSDVFSGLELVEVGDEIVYDLVSYTVKKVEVLKKSEINMDLLLLPEYKDTIVVMTCAGEMLSGGDATHRLIITAEAL